MIDFELLTQGRAKLQKKSKKMLNLEIWKEKVLIDKMRLPKSLYNLDNKVLTKPSIK